MLTFSINKFFCENKIKYNENCLLKKPIKLQNDYDYK